MAAFHQSTGLRWAIGLGVAAAFLGCVVVGLMVWIVISAVMIRKRHAMDAQGRPKKEAPRRALS